MVRRAGSADLPLHGGRLPKRASVPAGASLLAPAHAEDLVPQNGEDNAERSARPPIAEPDDDGAGDELEEEAQCGDVAGVAILPHVEHGDRQHDAMASTKLTSCIDITNKSAQTASMAGCTSDRVSLAWCAAGRRRRGARLPQFPDATDAAPR